MTVHGRAKLFGIGNRCAHIFALLGRGPKEAESVPSTSEGKQCHRSAGLAIFRLRKSALRVVSASATTR